MVGSSNMIFFDKILNNFRAVFLNFLVQQNFLEFCQTSHILRTDHQNRYFIRAYFRAWTVQNKKEPSISLETWSKHHQVISSKFSKSFRGARDLVMF